MIRVVSTTSLLALLILVLYLPSAYSPARFIDQLRTEHALATDFCGHDHATRILSRMLDLQATAQQASPIPPSTEVPAPHPDDLAAVKQMADVNNRLFNNRYFRSVDALLVLATYRVAVLIEWLPALLMFMLAMLCDGLVIRTIKSKEFGQHNPEVFGLYVCAAILTACATVLAFVMPVTLHPLAICAVPVAISIFVSRALADFHRRG